MKLAYGLLMALALPSLAPAAPIPEAAIIAGVEQRAKEAANMGEFLWSFNELMPENKDFVGALLGASILDAVPPMKFDAKKSQFFVGEHKIEIMDASKGNFQIDAVPFHYARAESFATNLRNMNRALSAKKTAKAFEFISSAHAEPQNWMSLTDQALEGAPDLANKLSPIPAVLGTGYYWHSAGLSNFYRSRGADVTWLKEEGKAVAKASYILAAIGPLYWATEHAHAYLATPLCSKQVADLKKILTEQKLSLARFSCSDPMITFKKEDGSLRSLAPYWRAGALVDSQLGELYSFSYDALKSMKRKEVGSGKGGFRNVDGVKVERPVLVEYKAGDSTFEQKAKELEPYRKALFYMGKNMSCMRCENEIVVGLTQAAKAPGSAPGPAPGAVPGGADAR
jgi:hypothetical protein